MSSVDTETDTARPSAIGRNPRYQLIAAVSAPGCRTCSTYTSANEGGRPDRNRFSRKGTQLRALNIASGNAGSWKKAMYHDLRICRLVSVARRNAAGCGIDNDVSERTRCGCFIATPQATAAPQS